MNVMLAYTRLMDQEVTGSIHRELTSTNQEFGSNKEAEGIVGIYFKVQFVYR